MLVADRREQLRGRGEATPVDGLALGVAQAAALAPGVSRNGVTLAAARWRRFSRAQANLLSRTIALPIIVGATGLKGARLASRGTTPELRKTLALGIGASFVSTLASQRLIGLVERDRALWPYAAYRVAASPAVRRSGKLHQLTRLRCLTRATERIGPVSDAYARSGVDQGAADSAVAGLVRALGKIELGRPSAQVPLPGHYASVIEVAPNLGIALSTDGVGTKLVLAEALGKLDTVGIDCVAMNVNDVICVGAEPLAMLDYIAIDRANPEICEAIGVGLARGATLAGIEIPGGELAQLGDMVHGVDVSGACFGTVALDAIVDGREVAPGDSIIGLPSSGLHSNGYTLARAALDGLDMGEDPDGRLGRPLGEALLEPTEIYVKPIVELLRSEVDVRGLAHITSGGVNNLLRLAAPVGYEIDAPLPDPAPLRPDRRARQRPRRGNARGLQHGLRLLPRRPRERRGPRPRPCSAPTTPPPPASAASPTTPATSSAERASGLPRRATSIATAVRTCRHRGLPGYVDGRRCARQVCVSP